MPLIGKEVWKIKDNAPVDPNEYFAAVSINFTSNNESFTSLGVVDGGFTCELQYNGVTYAGVDIQDPNSAPEYNFEWENDAYKTLEFDTAPTDELLAWLQKNADKITPSINIEESELLPSNYTINSAIQSNKEILLDKLELVPAQEDFNTASNDSQIHYCVSKSVLFNDPKADGNIVVSTENIDYTGVAPVSIKIGDGTTLFRDLPTLTSGNV